MVIREKCTQLNPAAIINKTKPSKTKRKGIQFKNKIEYGAKKKKAGATAESLDSLLPLRNHLLLS